jgi:hypothetical protein
MKLNRTPHIVHVYGDFRQRRSRVKDYTPELEACRPVAVV